MKSFPILDRNLTRTKIDGTAVFTIAPQSSRTCKTCILDKIFCQKREILHATVIVKPEHLKLQIVRRQVKRRKQDSLIFFNNGSLHFKTVLGVRFVRLYFSPFFYETILCCPLPSPIFCSLQNLKYHHHRQGKKSYVFRS